MLNEVITRYLFSEASLPNPSGGRGLLSASASNFLDASISVFGLPGTCPLWGEGRAFLSPDQRGRDDGDPSSICICLGTSRQLHFPLFFYCLFACLGSTSLTPQNLVNRFMFLFKTFTIWHFLVILETISQVFTGLCFLLVGYKALIYKCYKMTFYCLSPVCLRGLLLSVIVICS